MPIQLMHQPREEICELLQKLIRIDTTNPLGNETFAAQFLEQELKNASFECKIIEAKPARTV